MRAVVTGGAGFIGSHVVEALLARGDEVHVLDNLSKGTRERVAAGAELHVGDIRDPDAVFDAVRPEAVFHLAAQADVRLSVEHPEVDADVNVLGTVRILEAERQPLAPYGTSKLCGEEYLATWNRLHGTRHVSLRFANVYGPRQEPHGEAGVVAIFMGLLHEGGTPRIYGDGSQTRDYVFVEDAVGAMLVAFESDGGVFNVGTGVETSVLGLYDAIQRASRVTREPAFAEARLGELQRSVLDVSLAERELGWRPGSSLDEGLARTWAWIVQE
jgi:UDP-glucose 4-epimerase